LRSRRTRRTLSECHRPGGRPCPRVALVIGSIVLAASLAKPASGRRISSTTIYPTFSSDGPIATALRDVYRRSRAHLGDARFSTRKLAAARQTHPAIVFMGDSCTEFGSYPSKTLERLRTRLPAFATV
jgi:hypothetical protein